MDQWTVIRDVVFAVVPPIEIPLSLFLVYVALVIAAGVEIRSLRRLG